MRKLLLSTQACIDNILFMLRHAYRISKARVYSIAVLAVLGGVSAASTLLFYRIIIGFLQGSASFNIFLLIVAVFVAIRGLNSFLEPFLHKVKLPVWNARIQSELLKKLFNKYLEMDYGDIQDTSFYDKYVRAMNEADTRTKQVLDTIQGFMINLISAVSTLSIISILSPELILCSVLPVVFSTFINIKISRERFDYSNLLTKEERKSSYVRRLFIDPQYRFEVRTNIDRSFLEEKMRHADAQKISITKDKMPSIVRKSALGANIFSMINYGLPAIYLGVLLFSDKISIGDFSTLLVGTANLSSYIFYMVIIIPQLFQHSLFVDNLREVLNYRSSMIPLSGKRCNISNEEPHTLTLDHVSFQYKNSNKKAVDDVSIQINAGEKVALVGENGAGKTTIVKLLMRFYDPQEGKLLIDEIPYTDLKPEDIRQCMSTVFQDYQNLAFSISENICLKPKHEILDGGEVWNALDKSGLLEKVTSLPNKEKTALSMEFDSNGVELSGGESQKLTLARAVNKNAGILILDEPTSSFDANAEREMYTNMQRLGKGKTVILISHRMYSVKAMDRIFYLEDGKIIEQGTHDELLQLNGKYATMYYTQANEYK